MFHIDLGLSSDEAMSRICSSVEIIGGGLDTRLHKTSRFDPDWSGNKIHERNHVEECDPGAIPAVCMPRVAYHGKFVVERNPSRWNCLMVGRR